MPIRRFRNLAEAEQVLELEPGDQRIWEGVRRRWAIHRFLAPKKKQAPCGVFKYRSIEEKQRKESTMEKNDDKVDAEG